VEAQPQRISRAPSEPMRYAFAPRILLSRVGLRCRGAFAGFWRRC